MQIREKDGEGVKFEHDVRHETATEFEEIRGEYINTPDKEGCIYEDMRM